MVAEVFARPALTGSVNGKQARILWRPIPACCSGRNSDDIARQCLDRYAAGFYEQLPSITKLYSLCGCSSVHDSAVSSHSNSTGSDQPLRACGRMTRHFGSSRPVRRVRGNFVGVSRASVMALPPKIKNSHWQTSSPDFRDYHLLTRSPNAHGRSATSRCQTAAGARFI